MNYKPYQDVIKGKENSFQLVEVYGSVYLRLQSDPNNTEFCFQLNSVDDKNSEFDIYIDKTGSYEIDLQGIGLINTVYLKGLKENQLVIIDTLRQTYLEGVR